MNVLIYVLDALRADHVACYGYDRDTTPTIDRIAEEGVRYENCFSPATWTKPVGASLLTGAYPPLHGTRSREDVFDADITRLPETLSEVGITSTGFSTMGNVSASIGYGRGFDTYRDLYKDSDIVAKRQTRDTDSEELEHEDRDEIALPRAEDLSDSVVEWLETDAGDDFFAFCWSIEPHMPYDPPEGYRDYTDPEYDGPVDGQRDTLPDVETDADLEQLKALYDGGISYNDDELGRIVDALETQGIYDETMIVVLGDHGDAFNEHDRLTHGHLPYDELIHVPLVVKPATESGIEPQVVEETACLVDVPATVMSATGVTDVPETVEGRELPPFGPPGSSAPVFSETRFRDVYPSFYSVRTDEWKYMKVDEPNRDVGTMLDTVKQIYQRGLIWEIVRNPRYYLERYLHDENRFLYDLNNDPDEQLNLVDEQPERADEMESLLATWMEEGERRHERLSSVDDLDIDHKTSEQLKQLGYVE